MKKKTIISICAIVALVIILAILVKVLVDNGNTNTNISKSSRSSMSLAGSSSSSSTKTTAGESIELEEKNGEDVDYSNYTASINLGSLEVNGNGVSVSGTTITVSSAGTYYFTGTLNNGNIAINAGDNDKVYLVFENANITSTNTAVINGINAKKIIINLKDGSTNTFTDSSNYTVFTEDDEPNGTVFSKTDLIVNGKGTLKVNANYEDAIVSKDDLVIEDSTLIVTSADDGIRGTDSVSIKSGNITINSAGKSIKSNGYIIISDGAFTISSKDDGIHADGAIQIDGGTFNITATEGIEATYVKINDGTINISASDDGINAANKSTDYSVTIEINGGNITIKMGAGDTDAIDSNGNLYINGGTIDITANSPFDYDGEANYSGGTIIVNGEQTNTITNQMMGGGMMKGNRTRHEQ